MLTMLTAADNERRIVYGLDDGVYMSDVKETGKEPTKVLALVDVSQVDALEDYQLLVVLSGMCVFFPLLPCALIIDHPQRARY
jgi:hypothetical protein